MKTIVGAEFGEKPARQNVEIPKRSAMSAMADQRRQRLEVEGEVKTLGNTWNELRLTFTASAKRWPFSESRAGNGDHGDAEWIHERTVVYVTANSLATIASRL